MRKTFPLVAILVLFAISACSPSPQDYAQAEVIRAKAEATRIANIYKQQQNEQELAIRATASAAELQARIAKMDADREASVAMGQAKSRAIEAGGYGIVALLAGLSVALVVLAASLSIAFGRNSMLKSQYVSFGVEPSTLLPPPVIVTADGYLLDTRTGERARIRDAAGVNQLRLAATTQTTNLAVMARAAKDIAHTRNSRPSEVLPGIAESVPLISIIDGDK